MNTIVQDLQVVGEIESPLFGLIGVQQAMISLRNFGVNTMNYRFQQWNGSAWIDMGLIGSDLNSTLVANQQRCIIINGVYSKIQLVGNASGGAALDFTVYRFSSRESGGNIPFQP